LVYSVGISQRSAEPQAFCSYRLMSTLRFQYTAKKVERAGERSKIIKHSPK